MNVRAIRLCEMDEEEIRKKTGFMRHIDREILDAMVKASDSDSTKVKQFTKGRFIPETSFTEFRWNMGTDEVVCLTEDKEMVLYSFTPKEFYIVKNYYEDRGVRNMETCMIESSSYECWDSIIECVYTANKMIEKYADKNERDREFSESYAYQEW